MNNRNAGLFSITCFVAVIAVCSIANACSAPAPYSNGGSGAQLSPGACTGGDPIDLANGAYTASATDLIVKGRTRDIVITRHYFSADTQKVEMDAGDFFTQPQVQTDTVYWYEPAAPAPIENVVRFDDDKKLACTASASGYYLFSIPIEYHYGTSPYTYAQTTFTYTVDYSTKATPTILGKGWDLNYNIRLDEITTDKILLFDGTHKRYLFTKNGSGEYISPGNAPEFIKIVKNQSTYTLTKKRDEAWEFNSSGQITEMQDKNGNCTEFTYTDGNLTGIRDDLDNTITLVYSGGLLQTITDADGRQVSYGYTDGDLTTVKKPETSEYSGINRLTTIYAYTSSHQLEMVTDPHTDTWLINTYIDGKVTSQQYGDSSQNYSISYDTASNKATVTDRRGYHTVSTYNNDHYTLSEKVYDGTVGSSTCYTTSYSYTSDKNIDEITLPKGNKVNYNYDAYRNISSIQKYQGSDTLTTSMSYDDKGFIQTYTDPENHQWSFTYDYEGYPGTYSTNVGNLMKITMPTVKDENDSDVTPEINFIYNNDGQVTEINMPDRKVIKYDYGTSGNNNGRITKITYDYGTGNALNIDYDFTYDTYGNIDTITKPDNNTTIDLDYNTLLQLTQIQNELGYLTKYHYNKNGMLDKVQRQMGQSFDPDTAQTWQYDYDILDKLTTITNPLGYVTTLGRDDSENVTSIKDPEGDAAEYSTGYTYNARDLCSQVTDAESGQINYGYDNNGNVQTATDHNGKVTTYYWDFADRLWKISYPDSTYEQFTYDDSSNITQERKRDGTIIYYTYDGLNRKKTKQIGTGTITYFRYDIMGRLRYVIDGSTTVASYGYDRIGRLTSTTDSYDEDVSYLYNDNSLRTRLTYPDDSYISYEYYNDGRVRYIKDSSGNALAAFDYDRLGRIKKITYGNGEYQEFDYEDKVPVNDDNMSDNIEQVSYSVASMNAYDYLHDMVGNITDKDYDSLTLDYAYDKTYQLKTVDSSGGTADDWTFNYDHVHNRTSTVQDSTTRTYTLDTADGLNQYASLTYPSVSFTYDTKGNLTSDGTNKYVFNSENYMTTLTDQYDSTIASYTYDYGGRRISKTYDSVTTTYVYDGPHIIAEYEDGDLVRKYVYGPGIDMPLMMIAVDGETETRYYYFRDAVGSVVALLNNDGEDSDVIEAYSYGPFGKPKVHTAAGNDGIWLTGDDTVAGSPVSAYGNSWMFTARQWDYESGLYYYRARMYHPTIGRFLQPDPIGYYDSMNLYQYCGNNPVNWIDPYGTDFWVQGTLWGHRSFCVGNPNGAYSSYGFYPASFNVFGGPGEIKGDTPGGNWMHRDPVRTSSEKDCEIKNMMDQLANQYNALPRGERDGYWYGIYDCHSFANQMFNLFNESFNEDNEDGDPWRQVGGPMPAP